jgi:hypothetical protein
MFSSIAWLFQSKLKELLHTIAQIPSTIALDVVYGAH